MGLLSDFTAYVDSLKRTAGNALRETVNDPVGLLQMRLNQVAQQLPAYPGKESVMPGVEGGGLLSRPNVVDWGQAVAMNANQPMGLLGHTVYHGSPHKFDKFDASKIGTGEGAQAYGYGTYLAERPAVANSYREGLSDRVFSIGEETLNGPASRWGAMNPNAGRENMAMPQKMATYALDSAMRAKSNDPAQDAIKHLTKYGKGNKDAQAAIGVIRQWVDEGAKVEQGSLYTVDLPDEWLPKMLDWDKPLSQQPEAVRKALADNWLAHPDAHANQTGREIYNATATGQRDAASAAAELMKAGIPGIRYLDGGSRKSGEGTYNYVVFPGMEGLLKILSRE